MPKTVFVLVAFVVIISLTGFIVPNTSAYNVFLPSDVTSEICLLLTAALAVLFALTRVTKDFFASVLGFIGCSLIAIGLLGYIAPTYFGLFHDFVPQANLMALLVLGLSYSMVGLAVPHRNILAQITELRNVASLISLPQMSTETKLWMVNHTPILFHS